MEGKVARICRTCGRANDDDASFCQGCGASLSQARPAPPAPPPAAQPPPTTEADGGGHGGHSRAWLAVIVVAVALAAAATAATVYFTLGDGSRGETEGPVVEPTVAVSPATEVVSYLAGAVGPRADRLAAIDADGTVTPLGRFSGRRISRIAYSPDGAWLACVAGTERRSELWLFRTSTGDARQATAKMPAVVAVDSIAWLSPTELLVAGFKESPGQPGQNAHFLVYDVEHEGIAPLPDADGGPLAGVAVSASRDGTTVAFVSYSGVKTSDEGAVSADERLWLLDRDSGELTLLGENEASFEVDARAFDGPLLSPSGAALIYHSAGSDVETSYTVIGADGSTLMAAKRTQVPAGCAWDPEGVRVVFTGHTLDPSSSSGLGPAVFWAFDTRTGSTEVLARYDDTMVQDLSWSPDGQTIAWAEWDQEKYRTGRIYLMPATGGDSQALVKDALSPVWAPGAGPALETSTNP